MSDAPEMPAPDPRAQAHDGDDHLGVWIAICPVYGWDHAAVYNTPMQHVNCPHCWRSWGDEQSCELRHYDGAAAPVPSWLTSNEAFDIAWRAARRCGIGKLSPAQLTAALEGLAEAESAGHRRPA